MSGNSSNGEHVTRRELKLELRVVRWELRAWSAGLLLAVLWKLNVPQSAAETVSRLF